MKTKNNLKALIGFLMFSCFALTGCGGGGGGSIFHNSNEPLNLDGISFYDSKCADINNISQFDKTYSAYNGQNTLELKNISVDPNGEAVYACLMTNVGKTDISNLSLNPPGYYSVRATVSNDDSISCIGNSSIDSLPVCGFRENVLLKQNLEKELLDIYQKNEKENKNSSIRAAISHVDEIEGQSNIKLKALGKVRNCTLVKISKHGKFLVDQEKDGSIRPLSLSETYFNEFAEEFDNYIYPLLRDNFGNGNEIFWHDVDNDGKLSIVFSPVCNNYGQNIVGIFDSASMNDSRYGRDMVTVAVPADSVNIEKWYMDARETIAHEMQHIVNFCAKSTSDEELWINEGLSVCAEILYRDMRRKAGLYTFSPYLNGRCLDFIGNDQRFFYCTYVKTGQNIITNSFADGNSDGISALAHYGQKGLFFFYLYEQYGKEFIRGMCQSQRGRDRFNGLDRDLGQLIIDFNIAHLYEKIRNVSFRNSSYNSYEMVSNKHKFKANMNLNYMLDSYGYRIVDESDFTLVNLALKKEINLLGSTKLALGETLRVFLKQPKDFANELHSNNYTVTINSSNPVVVNMLRINSNY